MARNSKRNAFTIVELVIVIAVIAILSTVLITTFTGVIESANVSADKQLVSTLNTQLSMHIGKGNDIDTVDDLKTALNTQDINYWEKLDPKSAQYGYHYWYNPVKQEIVLSTYEKLENLNVKAEPIGRFLGNVSFAPRAVDNSFEAASPRKLPKGYYLLDEDMGNGNTMAEFYNILENLSTEDDSDDKLDYVEAYAKLTSVISSKSNKNKVLAEAVDAKMSTTAVVTDKGIFVKDADSAIANVYIPKNNNEAGADYYLGNQFINKSGDSVAVNPDNIDITTAITLPENIKVGEGALNDFGNVNVNVNITVDDGKTLADAFKEIFSAESVTGNITINGNINVTINVNVVVIEDKEVTLEYNNPVTSKVEISADGNVVDGHIALNKIKDGSINLVLGKNTLMSGASAAYNQDVEWEIVGAPEGVSIENGKIKIAKNFSGKEITVKARPVAVNSEEQKEALASDVLTLKVVKVGNATFKLETSNESYNLNTAGNLNAYVQYSDATTTAKFSEVVFNFVYADGSALSEQFTAEELAKLGAPEVTISGKNTYFEVKDGRLDFVAASLKTIGKESTQKVTVKIAEVGEYYVNVTLEPCHFTLGHTKYKGYTYTVGDDNSITLSKLFAVSDFFKGVTITNSDVVVKTYTATPDADGVPTTRTVTTHTLVTEGKASWADYEITLAQGTNLVEIGTNDNTFYVWVNVVDGKNVTDVAGFIGGAGEDNVTRVLHNDLSGFQTKTHYLLTLTEKSIFGNYYKIDASNLVDETSSGKSFMSMTGGSLNQVVLEGPVYPRALIRAVDDTDKQTGQFYFGITLSGSATQPVTIRDSYLSGFNSPVIVYAHTLNVYDSVFEGGSLANMYIRSGVNTVNLDGVKTIQNHVTGYKVTSGMNKDEWSNTYSSGMGIFVHNTQGDFTLNMTNTQQYNWFSEADLNADYASGDGVSVSNIKYDSLSSLKETLRFKNLNYLGTALKMVYDGKHNTFLHNGYANASIVSIDYLKDPALNIAINSNGAKYHYGTGSEGVNVVFTKVGLNAKIWTYDHSQGNCCSEDAFNYRTYDNFAECIEKDFLNSRLPNPVDYTK